MQTLHPPTLATQQSWRIQKLKNQVKPRKIETDIDGPRQTHLGEMTFSQPNIVYDCFTLPLPLMTKHLCGVEIGCDQIALVMGPSLEGKSVIPHEEFEVVQIGHPWALKDENDTLWYVTDNKFKDEDDGTSFS